MKRLLLVPLISLAVAFGARATSAQMPETALGQPLPDAGLPAGTVVVRVVDGSPTKPLQGTVVTLRAKSGERTARADVEGRATFGSLPAGSTWIASVPVEDGEPAVSQPIEVPAKGGMRVLLSVSPWNPGVPPINAPASGGKRPPPQDMASRPRGVQEIAPGSLQVRVVGGAWDKMIDKAVVHLVGLRADGGIIYKKEETNAAGLITFANLRGRDVAYYVLTTLQRGELDDRLMSIPVSLPPHVGSAMVLSGEVEGDPKTRDDLSNFYASQVAGDPDTSRVRAVLSGPKSLAGLVREVELLEIGQLADKTDVVAKGVVRADGQATGKFIIEGQPSQDDATGVLKVVVLRGADPKQPMPGVPVEVVPADGGEAMHATTDQRGIAELGGLTAGTKYVATVIATGTRITGEPTAMPEQGGAVSLVGVEWGQPIADISGLPADPDKVYLLQARAGGQMHRSPPFQLSRSSGTIVPLPISPPPSFVFQIEGGIHDEFMTWSADIAMSNSPYVPYSFGDDVLIPLPKGFVGGEVQKPWDNQVKVLQGRGLLWKGAVPPGGFQFRAFFGTRVDDGSTSFDLDLPYGATSSLIVFPHNDKVKVDVVGRAVGGPQKVKGREYYVLPNIEVAPQQRLVMRISGLPSPPRWSKWVQLGLGLVVLAMLIGAVSTLFVRGRSDAARRAEEDARKQERLLGELAELERAHRAGELPEAKYKKGKARLTKQLEPLYDRPQADHRPT